MNMIPELLARPGFFTACDATLAWAPSTNSFATFFIVFGALLFVTVAVFVWAAFFRKVPRRRHSHHHRHHWRTEESSGNGSSEPQPERSRIAFWRRHRRFKKKRLPNPTLAETGGLPPVRSSDSEPPGL